MWLVFSCLMFVWVWFNVFVCDGCWVCDMFGCNMISGDIKSDCVIIVMVGLSIFVVFFKWVINEYRIWNSVF